MTDRHDAGGFSGMFAESPSPMKVKFVSLILVWSQILGSVAWSDAAVTEGGRVSTATQALVASQTSGAQVSIADEPIAEPMSMSGRFAVGLATKLPTPAAVKAVADKGASAAVQTFFAGLIFLTTQEVANRLYREKLQIDPVTVKKLSLHVYDNYVLQAAVFGAGDASLLFPVSYFFSTASAKILQDILSSPVFSQVAASFVTSIIMTIGVGAINQIVAVANRLVIDNSTRFGVTASEIEQLQLLQSRFGISYFSHGLLFGGPVTKSAFRKVWNALFQIVLTDSQLRGVIQAHCEQELLTGKGVGSTAMFLFMSYMNTRLSRKAELQKWSRARRLTTGTAQSVGLAMLTAKLLPTTVSDFGTYYLRRGRESFLQNSDTSFESDLIFSSLKMEMPVRDKNIANTLLDRREDREQRVTLLMTLLNLSASRIDNLLEEQRFLRQRLRDPKNQTQGLTFFERLSLAKDSIALGLIPSFAATVGSNPYKFQLDTNAWLIGHYQKYFKRIGTRLQELYSKEAALYAEAAEKPNLIPATVLGLREDARKFLRLANFMSRLVKTIDGGVQAVVDPRNSQASSLGTDYDRARIQAESLAFWGFREADFFLVKAPTPTP